MEGPRDGLGTDGSRPSRPHDGSQLPNILSAEVLLLGPDAPDPEENYEMAKRGRPGAHLEQISDIRRERRASFF